jgi:hypothetical protein
MSRHLINCKFRSAAESASLYKEGYVIHKETLLNLFNYL